MTMAGSRKGGFAGTSRSRAAETVSSARKGANPVDGDKLRAGPARLSPALGRSRDPGRDPRILVHKAVVVKAESRMEVEPRRGVVVLLEPVLVADSRVRLVEPLHHEGRCAHVDGWSVGPLAYAEGEPTHREHVRARRCFQVHVETSVDHRRSDTVDRPAARAVADDTNIAHAVSGRARDKGRARLPTHIHLQRVVDAPGHAVLDRDRVSLEEMAVALAAREEHLEAGACLDMAPGCYCGRVDHEAV